MIKLDKKVQERMKVMKAKEFTRLIVKARKERRLSQSDACELLGISDASTLSKIENGIKIPSEEVVERMITIYDDPFIGYMYLRECNPIGRLLLPDIITSELDNLTLRFQKEYNDILKVQTDMIEIACDNEVSIHEIERWSQIQKELAELASVSLPLVIKSFIKNKKPSQGGNLVGASI